MNNIGNKLAGPNPQYTTDMYQAHQSVKKLAKLTFQRAVFGHGDPIDNGASQASRQAGRYTVSVRQE